MPVLIIRLLAILAVAWLVWVGLRWWVRHVVGGYASARQALTDYRTWRKANDGVLAPRADAAAEDLEKALARWEAGRGTILFDTALTARAARKRLTREHARTEPTIPRRNP